MYHELFYVEIGDEPLPDLQADLLSLEVELDDRLAGHFRLRLGLRKQPDGAWSYLDDERLQLWEPVSIAAGFSESGSDELLSGYITHIQPEFAAQEAQCALEIWGMDRSVLLDRQEVLKDWPDKKDSDIACEIFEQYSLSADIEDTQIVHDQRISTIIQRETDMQFLRRLARRSGFECYVEGDTGYFRPPQLSAAPQPVLALHFGEQTNLTWFSLESNGTAPADVRMSHIDRLNKEQTQLAVTGSERPLLGQKSARELMPRGLDPGLLAIDQSTAVDVPEMTALCQALFDEAAWFVSGEGEINSHQYGHVLRPRGLVTIKGLGATHSGLYYVCHVTHRFTGEGYTQHFRVRRNALLPTGEEDFAAESGLF